MLQMPYPEQIPAPQLIEDDQLDYTSKRLFSDNLAIIDALKGIIGELKLLRGMVGQESPAPSIVTLPLLGNTARFHVQTLTVTVTAACIVSLVSGSVVERAWNFGGADTKVLAYPLLLENGKDYTLTFSAGSGSGYFTGYTETTSEPI